MTMSARLASLRELQSAMGEELRPLSGRTLLPSVLDRAFKGDLIKKGIIMAGKLLRLKTTCVIYLQVKKKLLFPLNRSKEY